MARISNKTIRTKMGMKRHIKSKTRTAIKMVWPCHANGGLQNGTHRGKGGGAAEQTTNGRMGLGTACKEETSRINDILIEITEGKKSCL
jgi:hypothetical protein